MNQICRVCLEEDAPSMLSSFSSNLNAGLTVLECYKVLITSIDSEKDDEGLLKICQDCLLKLDSFYGFRCQALKNNELLMDRKYSGQLADVQVKQEINQDPLSPFHFLQIKLEDESTPKLDEAHKKSLKRRTSKMLDEKSNKKSKSVKVKEEKDDTQEIISTTFKYQDHGSLLPQEEGMSIFKRKIICNHCNKQLLYIGFSRHCEKKHLNQRKFPCTQCEKTFDYEIELNDHLQKHLGYISFSCPTNGCDAVFYNKNDLSIHSEQCQPQKKNTPIIGRIVCVLCGKSYRKDSIKSHNERVHLKKKDYECDLCSRHFFKKEHVLAHLYRHLNIKPYACTSCDKTFISNETRMQHSKNHLPNENRKLFKCSYPGCTVTSFQSLSQHVKIFHLKLRPHSCPHPDCGRTFDTASAMRKHIPKHLTEANFVCDCGQKFKSELFLRNHRRFKHELPRYPCPVENCGQRFHMPSILQIHDLKVHQGIKKFVCHLCSKSYTKKELLQIHISDIHFKNKAQCFLCSAKFARIATLRQHAKKHHRESEEQYNELMLKISGIRSDFDQMQFVYE